MSVNHNAACTGIIESWYQVYNRSFAGATRAYKSDFLPGPDREGDIIDYGTALVIRETYIFEIDIALDI